MEFIRLTRKVWLGTGDSEETVYVRRDDIRTIQEHAFTDSTSGETVTNLYTEVDLIDGRKIESITMTADEVHELARVKPWERESGCAANR